MGDKGVTSPSSSGPSPGEDRDQDQDVSSPEAAEQTSQLRSPIAGDGQPKPTVPMQKRRRVTRACDECRRKKIKCDGKQPCTHCTVYSYGMWAQQSRITYFDPAADHLTRMYLRSALQSAEKPRPSVYRGAGAATAESRGHHSLRTSRHRPRRPKIRRQRSRANRGKQPSSDARPPTLKGWSTGRRRRD